MQEGSAGAGSLTTDSQVAGLAIERALLRQHQESPPFSSPCQSRAERAIGPRSYGLAPAASDEPVASAGGLAPLITSHSMIAISAKKAG